MHNIILAIAMSCAKCLNITEDKRRTPPPSQQPLVNVPSSAGAGRCRRLLSPTLPAAPAAGRQADICAEEGMLPFLVKTLTYDSLTKSPAVSKNGGGILRNISSHVAVREDYRSVGAPPPTPLARAGYTL